VEAGVVIEWRNAIEPKRDVGSGADEFCAIDHARLQAYQNLSRRGRLRRDAKPSVNLAAETKRPQLEAAHIGQSFHFAAEPPAHAVARTAAHQRPPTRH